MGEPQLEEQSTTASPTEEVDSSRDRPALSDNGQPVFDQLHTTAEDQSDIPGSARDENPEKPTPRHKRFSERVPDNQTSGGGVNGGGVGVSVTWLTLDADLDSRPHSRQHFLPSPRTDRDGEMSDLKLIRDFQIRRKYGRRPPVHGRPAKQSKNAVDLGLSGTRYFTNSDTASNSAGSSLDSSRTSTGKLSQLTSEDSGGRLQMNSTPASSIVVSKLRTTAEEDRSSVDSTAKDLQSPVPSFPPLSPGGARTGNRSESSFYSSRHSGQSPSLLSNHFGFSTIRPDTFSGMQRHRRMRLTADSDNDDLLKELEQHAQKQILACQNMGYTHRGSRAAESVLSLKHTVSPSAFHPSSFFTRHVPREEIRTAGSPRSGTPVAILGTLDGETERPPVRRRVTPAGKLSMPRLVLTDRQEKAAARRTTLPTVSGSSLQVVLAQSHGK